jgi:transposase
MDHVAIDVGGRESQICRRSPDATILEELRWATNSLGDYLAQLSPSRVVLETCAESFKLADLAQSLGHQVKVVPATLAPQLGVGARKLKTDKRDARALSKACCLLGDDLPSVHIPSKRSRERSSLCGMREALVEARTALVNTVRGYLRGQVLSTRLKRQPSNMAEGVRLLFKKDRLELPHFVERQLQMLEHLTEAIDDADKELSRLANADEDCRRLMTAPGVGPVTAIRFTAAIDNVQRFSKGREVGSYIGLTPGENSSSDSQHRLGITKAGSRKLRWILVQAAWAARIRYQDDPMVQWAHQLSERRGKMIATVALARKLAVVLHAMLRDKTTYQPRAIREIPMTT